MKTPHEKIRSRIAKDKTRFLETLKTCKSVTRARIQSGIAGETLYRWQREDELFAKQVEEIQTEVRCEMNDIAEGQYNNLLVKGNPAAVLYHIKNHHTYYSNKISAENETKIIDAILGDNIQFMSVILTSNLARSMLNGLITIRKMIIKGQGNDNEIVKNEIINRVNNLSRK